MDLPTSRAMRNKCLLFTLPKLWHFSIVAPTDEIVGINLMEKKRKVRESYIKNKNKKLSLDCSRTKTHTITDKCPTCDSAATGLRWLNGDQKAESRHLLSVTACASACCWTSLHWRLRCQLPSGTRPTCALSSSRRGAKEMAW